MFLDMHIWSPQNLVEVVEDGIDDKVKFKVPPSMEFKDTDIYEVEDVLSYHSCLLS